MKALVIGCGSIGKRHLRNLRAVGVSDLLAYDPREDRRAEAVEQSGARAVADLDAALKEGPDLCVVATPNSLHLEPALKAARAGCHLFIEKPLSHTLDRVAELEAEASRRKLTVLVGCNMRFHPGIALIGESVRRGEIGRIVTARVTAGSYLPEWHPWEDYRKGYSARADLGGGAILDGIHEIDYLLDLLGEAETVACVAGRFGDIEVETEDAAEILLRMRSGALASIHLDYLQRAYRRDCLLSGTEGSIEWSFDRPCVRVYSAKTKAWDVREFPAPEVNEMYVAEMRHLLDCLTRGAKPLQGLPEARRALEVAVAAKEAAASGRTLELGRVGAAEGRK